MRLDKFLKLSRIIKRRTLANEACAGGRVRVNGRVAKPSAKVKAGDVVELSLGQRTLRVKVTETDGHIGKQDASSMYSIMDQKGE